MIIESVQLVFQWIDTPRYARDLRGIKRIACKLHWCDKPNATVAAGGQGTGNPEWKLPNAICASSLECSPGLLKAGVRTDWSSGRVGVARTTPERFGFAFLGTFQAAGPAACNAAATEGIYINRTHLNSILENTG